MAGITVPTLVLLLIMSADAIHRLYFAASTIWVLDIEVTRLERALIFPMAFVPNLWGLWNAIYVAVHRHQPAWPLGLHGALLVLFLVPAGVALLGALGVGQHQPRDRAAGHPVRHGGLLSGLEVCRRVSQSGNGDRVGLRNLSRNSLSVVVALAKVVRPRPWAGLKARPHGHPFGPVLDSHGP